MVPAIDALHALLEASFTPVEPALAETQLARFEAELVTCFEGLLASAERVPFEQLTALAVAFGSRTDELPPEVRHAHLEWHCVHHGMYKVVWGPNGPQRPPDLPEGAVSIPLALVRGVRNQLAELRYAIHRREQPLPCDCAALIACGLDRCPTSPELRRVGPSTDPHYLGVEFDCSACGTRWLEGIADDDRGGFFWEVVSPR